MEVGTLIYDIGSNLFRNYLLKTPLGWIAVDTGYAGGFARFARRFAKLAPLSELKVVFLTHAHDDHAGYLGELLSASGAKLICNEKSLPALAAGENPVPEGAGYANRIALLSRCQKCALFPRSCRMNRDCDPMRNDLAILEMGLPCRFASART
jgi:glyoxylase-like metal-dependent hydrolase (beta-lactamase superfamily II)